MEDARATIRRAGQHPEIYIDSETGLFGLLAGLILVIRATHLRYNTLFLDEAIYINAGHDILSGHPDWHNMLSVFGGSPFYPLLAGLMDQWGGVVGARLLSAVLSTLTAIIVFGTTRRLFGYWAALWAMLIFGFTGASISVGQMAVYDAVTLMLLASAGYCLVLASGQHGRRERWCLLGAGVALSLATLSKYVGLFYVPALALVMTALYVLHGQGRRLRAVFAWFLIPVGLILGAYMLAYLPLLRQAIGTGIEHGARWTVLRTISAEIGPAVLLAAAGGVLLPVIARMSGHGDEALVVQLLSGWLHRRRVALALAFFFLSGLFAAFLLLPAYQVIEGDVRSTWKHTVASLIFLSPLAGFAIARTIKHFRSGASRTRLLGAALTVLALYGFVNYGLDRNWGFQNSWPNIDNAVAYLQARGLSPHTRVLAEGSASYVYYLRSELRQPEAVSNTYGMQYRDLTGAEAMLAAIRDHYFDFVVLDDNFTPALNGRLENALAEAGYAIGFQEQQTLTIGNRLIRIYEPSAVDGRGK